MLAGFADGAMVGLVKAEVIAVTRDLTEYWLALFGAIGSLIGRGSAVLSTRVRVLGYME